jgi:hypothetical protein
MLCIPCVYMLLCFLCVNACAFMFDLVAHVYVMSALHGILHTSIHGRLKCGYHIYNTRELYLVG